VPKTYVLDTNVLLHNPNAIYAFSENNVVIPLPVIEEIDNCKKSQDEIGRHARIVSRELDALRQIGQLSRGVPLKNGGTLRIELNHQEISGLPKGLESQKYDNRILAVAQRLSEELKEAVLLVTKDLNLRIKADVVGIQAEDFTTDKVDYPDLFTGADERYLTAEEFQQFFENNELPWYDETPPYANTFMVLKNLNEPSQSALGRYLNEKIHPLTYLNEKCWGLRTRNKEQRFAIELLMDDTIKAATLVGAAGTGKTLLALAAGMETVQMPWDCWRI
jgi:PhoH-like ATPase